MFSFEKFLFEAVKSEEAALRVFGLNDVPESSAVLTALYRRLSLQYHPDLGGSEEKMKDLNQAKDILSSLIGKTGEKGIARSKEYWDDVMKKREKENAEILKNIRLNLESNMNPAVFQRYFSDVFKEEFSVKYDSDVFKDYYQGNLRLSNKDGSIVADVLIITSIYGNYKKTSHLGSSNGVVYQTYFEPTIIANNKKYKLGRKSWSVESKFDLFSNPEVIFPRKRMETITKSIQKTDITAETPLKPASLRAVLEKKYDATYRKDSPSKHIYSIPLFVYTKDEKQILVHIDVARITMSGQSMISVESVYGINLTSEYKLPIQERYRPKTPFLVGLTYDKLMFLEKFIEKAKTKKTMKDVAALAETEFKKKADDDKKKMKS